MRIVQLVAQVQIQFEDGSVLTYGTPPLAPNEAMTEDKVRDTLMSLGLTPQQAQSHGIMTPDELVLKPKGKNGPRLFGG